MNNAANLRFEHRTSQKPTSRLRSWEWRADSLVQVTFWAIGKCLKLVSTPFLKVFPDPE